MTLLRACAILGLLAILSACAAAPPGAAPPTDCAARGEKARVTVARVIDEHLACTTDADCVTVAFGNACFDSCSRQVSSAGREAVTSALTSPVANDCAGCTVIAPPCAPPQAPRCHAGRCE